MRDNLLKVLLAAFLLLTPVTALADDFDDPPILSGAKMLEKGRYRSPYNYNETLMTYRRILRNSHGGFRWHTIIHQNSIKAKYLENTHKGAKWAGINIYEHNGETRIFVVLPSK